MSKFYDDMFELMEEAADRAALSRYRATCPKMSDTDAQAFLKELMIKYGRVQGRLFLERCLDLHAQVGMFDEYGDVLK